jgi:transposase-like protein
MMTNKDYKEMVEKKYGKPLKDIMYELCVIRDVVPSEGASELGVPKNTFLSWRNQFRFGPLQRMADYAEQMRKETINEYKKELQNIDLERDFIYKDEISIKGFKELMERFLELEKYKRTLSDIDSSSDMSIIMMKIASIEQTLSYLTEYEQGKLYERFNRESKLL